jgi:demethylmenaquinone methyltransferase/2-methoxy-6-polyprenyl-1,4-benzoquinol methylase
MSQALACPGCRSPLRRAARSVQCTACGLEYSIVDGIPLLVLDEDDEHKDRQAAHFGEEEDAEFETTRPRGTTQLYEWLLEEKFRRSVRGIQDLVGGSTALTVCGGSGMDAELLARAGAQVVSADISFGAARRTRERARRYGVEITPVVADAERLPFADRAFDLVYVHDGLHHLEHPEAGLAEMARVARRAASVTEPARAAITALAVRFGLALELEPAGNPVARLELGEVTAALREHGFRIVEAHRYGMYYRHHPGPLSHLLSRPRLFPLARSALLALNDAVGGIGNKLTVQAVRPDENGSGRD